MRQGYTYPIVIIALLLLFSCTKDVDIDFPDVEATTVVDGSISPGQPAVIFMTRSQSFNDPLDPNSLEALFENDASVQLSNGTDTIALQEICASELSQADLLVVAQQLGISPQDLAEIDYCAYIDLFQQMTGEIDTDYILDITTADGRVLHAETRIPAPVALDSLWFEYWAASDSLGFVHALLQDPAGESNAYRWRAQRINAYPNGRQKDFGMVAPLGSHFEDRFFDGLNFELVYNRGTIPNSNAADDINEEAGFFKEQDTVRVEFSATTAEAEKYWTLSDDQLVNNGSPFAVPANLPSNVEGGFGLWAGYAPVIDTLVCVE